MRFILILPYLFYSFINLSAQPILTDSNLPIMIIDTEGISIPDEPKLMAKMGLINNGELRNAITDEFNEYDGWIGIERRGSTSQQIFEKIGFGFETRTADEENNNVSLLGMPEENDWVLHGPYSDKTLIRSALAYKFAEQIMPYAPRTRFIELIINNDYRGVYVLIEKIKRDKNRVDVSKLNPDENEGDDLTGGYIIKHDKGYNGSFDGWESNYSSLSDRNKRSQFLYHYPKAANITEIQKNYIQSYIDTLEQVLKSPNFADPDNGYRKYINVSSFIDFMWVNEIARNVDGYRLSTFMYKDKESSDDGRLHMGPVWDFNLAFGNANYCEGGNKIGWGYNFNRYCPDDFWVIHFWWERLRQDIFFRTKAQERWQELRNNQWSDERLEFTIDSMTTLLNEGQERNFARWDVLGKGIWPNNFVGPNYFQEVRYLKNWLRDRLEWMDRFIENYTNPIYDPIAYEIPNVYPNPTSGLVTIDYYARTTQPVQIRIYNAQGQLVEQFENMQPDNNENSVEINLPTGSAVYFYVIYYGEEREQSGKIFVN